ncbi:hypothetical protein BX600DRAFT_70712 [Xylariales sp. PMI_506]|nr:hypothetical protein BX600DRAFT_70712 [Xylariales sp. PMI_506]
MCFFEITAWSCQYWKWGRFRAQCYKENRVGETCGLKLVYSTEHINNSCTLCSKISTKSNKILKKRYDIERWQTASCYPATVEKTKEELDIEQEQLSILHKQHDHGRFWIADDRRRLVGLTILNCSFESAPNFSFTAVPLLISSTQTNPTHRATFRHACLLRLVPI